jgi:flagellar L-ring protein precursor FlgH
MTDWPRRVREWGGRAALAMLVAAAAIPATAARADAAGKKDKAKAEKPIAPDNYDQVFAAFLAEARNQPPVTAANPAAWMNSLMTDLRARHVNDLVTVRVLESITASGTADSSLGKSSSSGIGVPNLFGVEKHLPSAIDPTNLATLKGDTTFKGSGSTTRAGALTAMMTARVTEVLPNGDLVVQGVREIDINGDRQIVVLSGVARVSDIDPSNTILSTSLGQLRIRYFGQGLMKDSLSPGWLVRILNKIF